MQYKAFQNFYDPVEANIILNKLQANNINCFLTNEHAASVLWHLSIAHGGVQLMMDEKDFEKARMILQDESLLVDDIDGNSVRCPKCNSNNVARGVQSQKRMNWFQILFSLILTRPIPSHKRAYHCFNCGHNFE